MVVWLSLCGCGCVVVVVVVVVLLLCGSVNGGWLGRVCTTLHLHVPYITYSTSTSFVCFFCIFSSLMISCVMASLGDVLRTSVTALLRSLADMEFVLTNHLHT